MEKCSSQPHLQTAPWRQNRTPRRQHSRGRTGAPVDAESLNAQGGEQPRVPSHHEEPIFEPADFPRLNSTKQARSKTPKRDQSRHATPKTPRREKQPIGAAPQQYASGGSRTAVSKTADAEARPIGASADAFVKNSKDAENYKVREPVRATSMPPETSARATSLPPENSVGAMSTLQASRQAAEAAKAHGKVNNMIQSLVRAAEQVNATNFQNNSNVNTFLKEFSDTVQEIKESHPRLPAGATDDDTAALLALNLILDVSRSKAKHMQVNNLAPIEEGKRLLKASSESYLPTPCRSSRVRFSDQPQSGMAAYARPTPIWFQAGSAPYPPTIYGHTYPPGNFSGAQLRAISSEPPAAISRKKYTVVNPRTGERLTVSSVVPFSWRQSKRMRIVNPRTGEEVLPYGKITAEDLQSREKERSSHRPRSASIGVAGRTSIGSVASSACQSDISTASTRRRRSIVGGTVKEGSSWALEPSSGGFWDWPLSRQEKKERFLLLGQLQMATEIEELQLKLEEVDCR